MAGKTPDIRILIGAEGGATSGGSQIKQELQSYFKDGFKIKIKLDDVDIGSIKAKIAEQTKAQEASNQATAKQTRSQKELQKGLDQEEKSRLKNEAIAKRVAEQEAKRAVKLKETTANINAQSKSQMASFNQYLQTLNPKSLSQHMGEANEILGNLRAGAEEFGEDAEKSFKLGTNGIKTFKATMKELGAEGGNVFTYLEGKIKTFAVYLASSAITMGAVNGIRNMVSAVKDLDEALTDLRIVTGDSKEDARELLNTYNQMAQELGSTTTKIAEAAVEWQRQGYNPEDTNTLIRASSVLSAVGMVDDAESAKYLTSAIRGYKVELSNVMGVVDKLTSVDLKAAVSAGGLAEAMSRTANSARLAGVDMDTLLGYIAAVGEVTQREASSVGEGFKRIFSRYSDVKLGKLIDDQGEELNDFEIALDNIGVKLRYQSGELAGYFRPFNDVLSEVVEKYKSMGDNVAGSPDWSGVAKALGGTMGRENVLTLFENYDKALEYAKAATDSAGTAMEKFEARQEGLEAKQNKLTAAFENMANSIIPSGLIGFFYDLGTGAANAAASFGGLPAKIAAGTAALIAFNTAVNMLKDSSIKTGFTTTIKDLGWPTNRRATDIIYIVPSHSKEAA